MGNCMFAVWNNLPEELHLALPENLFHFLHVVLLFPPHVTSFLLILLFNSLLFGVLSFHFILTFTFLILFLESIF